MDWVVSFLGITARIALAEKKRYGWAITFCGNIAAIYVAVDRHIYGFIPLSIVGGILSVYGYWRWGQD